MPAGFRDAGLGEPKIRWKLSATDGKGDRGSKAAVGGIS